MAGTPEPEAKLVLTLFRATMMVAHALAGYLAERFKIDVKRSLEKIEQ